MLSTGKNVTGLKLCKDFAETAGKRDRRSKRVNELERNISQLPKPKDLGLCEAYTKRSLHELNSFLQ